jgi:hypothetical protein
MCVVPNMAVFCSSLISYFSVMFVGYFLNDFEMVPCVHEESACNSWLLKMVTIGRAETSVTNYQSTLRNVQDERRLPYITSLKSEVFRNEI